MSVEIKTVNNRFLDVNMRLPGDLQAIEAQLKRLIASRLSRGRADVFLTFERGSETVFELNRPIVEGYIRALRELKDEFGLPGEPDLNSVIRLPNALVAKRTENPEDGFVQAVERALGLALDDLEKMREAEGKELARELEDRLARIEVLLPVIETEASSVSDEHAEKLSKRITEMLQRSGVHVDVDQGRLAQEVAYLADRSDISEEITRLRVHIGQYRAIMAEEKEVGKRLDFLTQELNREANTISSKTGNLKIKESALAIKSEVEKIREQIQNVE